MFLEILKAILMGIVEGITEWLPISSTGHMILVEQVVKFNASEEFMSMFRVVIQLGAIMAVVVLFWGKLWPFGLRHGRVISKPSVWQLWFKVVAATIPVLIISPLDDWFETRFYNYITVAAMLILYGALFFVVENRRAAPHVSRLEQITYRDAIIIGLWQCLAIIPGTSRSGATIVGGLLLGLSRACVAEFTFYLAIPVMAGASLLKVLKFAVSGVAITGTEIAVLAVGCVVLITVYMVLSGVPAIHKIGLFQFLFGTKWASTAAQPLFGILPFILSSIYGTLGAAIIGVPIGLLTAVFLSKAADPKLRTVVVTAIELLSGIPSVVFGLLGMQVLVPAVAKTFGKASGACLLSAIVVLAVMILPFIEVRAEKAFREVPAELVRSSYSLGCSKLYTIMRIVLPVCRGELVSGIILGGCYAMGATAPMIFTGAVAYAAVPDSIFSPAMALPLHLYLLVAQGSTSMDTAYGTAFVMMAMILLSSLLATAYARRSQNRWKRS